MQISGRETCKKRLADADAATVLDPRVATHSRIDYLCHPAVSTLVVLQMKAVQMIAINVEADSAIPVDLFLAELNSVVSRTVHSEVETE